MFRRNCIIINHLKKNERIKLKNKYYRKKNMDFCFALFLIIYVVVGCTVAYFCHREMEAAFGTPTQATIFPRVPIAHAEAI